MGKPIAHVRPLILANSEYIGKLICAIEKDSLLEVVADPDERGSFTVVLRDHARWQDEQGRQSEWEKLKKDIEWACDKVYFGERR